MAATGLKASDLTAAQKDRLLTLIKAHAEVQANAEQARRLKGLQLEQTRFTWLGSKVPGKGHYYRIQGPTVLIEYDNTQNNANHVHAVWRDFDGDFGEDVLADHYHSAAVHHGHDQHH